MAKLHLKQLAQSSASTGQAPKYNAGTGLWEPGAVSVQRPASTAPLLHWKFDESASPWANSGSAGALNLTAPTGSVAVARRGLDWGYSVWNNNNGSGADGLHSGTGTTSVGETSGSWTLLVMLTWLKYVTGVDQYIVSKFANTGALSPPYTSIILAMSSGNYLNALVTKGGTRTTAQASVADSVTMPGRLELLGMSYDISTGAIVLCRNGDTIGTATISGGGATDWASHGPWVVGGSNLGGGVGTPAIFHDVRLEPSIISPASQATMRWGA